MGELYKKSPLILERGVLGGLQRTSTNTLKGSLSIFLFIKDSSGAQNWRLLGGRQEVTSPFQELRSEAPSPSELAHIWGVADRAPKHLSCGGRLVPWSSATFER